MDEIMLALLDKIFGGRYGFYKRCLPKRRNIYRRGRSLIDVQRRSKADERWFNRTCK